MNPRLHFFSLVCCLETSHRIRAPTPLGVRRSSGADLPQVDIGGSLVAIDGRTFLVYDNYDALMRYNCIHRYALTVAMFAEQLR